MAEIVHQRSSTSKLHIAVCAFPFGTHAPPLLNLTRRLATATPHASFSFFTTAKSNASLFTSTADTPDNFKAYDVGDGLPVGYQPSGNPMEEIELFLHATPGNFKDSFEVAVANTGNITCVLSDAFLYFAAEMTEELGIPWVPFWTAGTASISIHFHTDLIRDTIGVLPNGFAGREDEQLGFIPGMESVRLQDLPEGVIFGPLESTFSRMLHQMGKMLPRAAALIINSFEELDPTIVKDLKSKLKKLLLVGPFALVTPPPSVPDETGCLSWLDGKKHCSVVYISFGTVTAPQATELAAVAEGLEASNAPYLWSLREQLHKQLPRGFVERTKERGVIVQWVPQTRILRHPAVAVFVTHCGWNSVSESIISGTPMICRPFFGDQRLNGRLVTDVWRIGIRVEGDMFTKDGLVKSLDLILSMNEGTEIRENGRRLKEMAEKAVGDEGRSTENFKAVLQSVV
ncbi:PREDICTED: anthocyanidin 3-O-glucosyltransferase 7-like [Nelumbo nucifera]|uniref:Glycosyltransferase n=2 Tax=Nelumbo nucifera TaxID=4432 RepID=A0A822ZQX9_NELNU|nr:PREDICTED: anthocyanidin 3-O-glucosyltransferase 7-like [Nelumbo nucifera]DAD45749.1 TPA_asm: hypothetical protein HUJ06_003979 [Nelumbo nucifera]